MKLGSLLSGQLARPTGLGGWLVGRLMAKVNAEPNRLAIQALDLRVTDHVLELGFGPGLALEAMSYLVPEGQLFGIDQSPVMLRQAEKRNADAIRAHRMSLHIGDFAHIPVETETIDKILAVNVIYFWHDSQTILAELRRVLRLGGRLAIYATAAHVLEAWGVGASKCHRLFNETHLRDMLVTGGFRPSGVKIRTVLIGGRFAAMIAIASKEVLEGEFGLDPRTISTEDSHAADLIR